MNEMVKLHIEAEMDRSCIFKEVALNAAASINGKTLV